MLHPELLGAVVGGYHGRRAVRRLPAAAAAIGAEPFCECCRHCRGRHCLEEARDLVAAALGFPLLLGFCMSIMLCLVAGIRFGAVPKCLRIKSGILN